MFKDLEGNEGVYWNTKVGAFNQAELIKYRNRDIDSFYVEKAVYKKGSKTWGLVLKAKFWDFCNYLRCRVNIPCEGVFEQSFGRVIRKEGSNIFKCIITFPNSKCDPCDIRENIIIDNLVSHDNNDIVIRNYPNKIILTPAQIKKLFNCDAKPTGDDNKGL